MPVSTSYPGIYIQELPSQSQTITPSPTSVTVFVGYTHPFETNPSAPGVSTFNGQPLELFSFTDYERYFGGLYLSPSVDSNVAFAVQQFFLNGGSTAYVVGLQPLVYDPTSGTGAPLSYSSPTFTVANSNMTYTALQPTDAANQTTITFSNQKGPVWTGGSADSGYSIADITITYGSRSEVFRGVAAGSVNTVLANSQLVFVTETSTPPSTLYPYGLFPPTAAAAAAPAAATSTTTLSYPTAVLTFPGSPMIFSPVGSFSATSPISIAFSNQGGYDATTGGYTTATITITSGPSTSPTVHSYSVTSDDTLGTYIGTVLTGTTQVTMAAIPGTGNPLLGLFPPLNPVNSAAPGTQTASLPLMALTPYFRASDFTAVLQANTLLDKLAVFNILVVPGITDPVVLTAAVTFAELKRAFAILDTPALDTVGDNLSVEDIVSDTGGIGAPPLATIPASINAALYFPYLLSPNPLSNVSGATLRLPPSGFVAGIYASTDQNRGVWKAPAGLATVLTNAQDVVPEGVMTDGQAGVLNQNAINAIRTFPGQGTVVFGARTVVGQTLNTTYQQWRYVPVRRTALFIEQTLYANLGWVIFEPNDTPLWNAIKSTIERFMLSLFSQGAFQGSTPSQAFLVKCDSSTTTQDDINNGIVNVLVGFAPLKPAEFVIIQITQLAGQASS
jgi:uncharacterized protein